MNVDHVAMSAAAEDADLWRTHLIVTSVDYTVTQAGVESTVRPKIVGTTISGNKLEVKGTILVQQWHHTSWFRLAVEFGEGTLLVPTEDMLRAYPTQPPFEFKFPNKREWITPDSEFDVVRHGTHTTAREFTIYFDPEGAEPEDMRKIVISIPFNGTTDPGACLLYTSPSPRDQRGSRMPSSA